MSQTPQQKEELQAIALRRENEELRKKYYENAIYIQNIENINAEQFSGQTIKVKGTPFKIKKEDRVRSVRYECPSCGNIIKIARMLGASEKLACTCGYQGKKRIYDVEHESGFIVTLINNMSDISSSEHIKAFVPFKALAIDASVVQENQAIKEFLKATGNTLEIYGELQSTYVTDSKTKKVTVHNEVYAYEVYQVDDLQKFVLTLDMYNEVKDFMSKREWDNDRVENIIVPEIKGRILTKKLTLLTMLTVKELKRKGKVVSQYGTGRGAIFGDYGESKSKLCKLFIQYYCEGLNALQINNETMTKAGLVAGVTKDGDEWIIDWGILPWANNGLLIMDGFHMFDKQTIASLRETETNNTIELYKIVKGKRECAYRSIKVSNCRKEPIREHYRNKYLASFDIGYGENDEEGKFNTADRRRVDWIIVYSKDDVATSTVDEALADSFIMEETQKHDQLSKIFNTLIKFAWTRKIEHIDNTNFDDIRKAMSVMFMEWDSKYKNIKLSVFEKDRFYIMLKYVIASAILHFRVTSDGKITPTIDDVFYVKDIYEEMFAELEVTAELMDQKVKFTVSTEIFKVLNAKQKQYIRELYRAGNISKLSESMDISRTTFYNQFKDTLFLNFGTINIEYKAFEPYFGQFFKIEPLFYNGKLTSLGSSVAKQIEQFEQSEQSQGAIGYNDNSNNNSHSYNNIHNIIYNKNSLNKNLDKCNTIYGSGSVQSVKSVQNSNSVNAIIEDVTNEEKTPISTGNEGGNSGTKLEEQTKESEPPSCLECGIHSPPAKLNNLGICELCESYDEENSIAKSKKGDYE